VSGLRSLGWQDRWERKTPRYPLQPPHPTPYPSVSREEWVGVDPELDAAGLDAADWEAAEERLERNVPCVALGASCLSSPPY
jgi:hypothetical protein